MAVVGRDDQPLNRRLVELEGQQGRRLVAGHAEVRTHLLRDVAQLLVGGRLVEPAPGLVGGVGGLVVVEPVVGLGHADRTLADGQQLRPQILPATDGVPAAIEKEDAAPSTEAGRHQCVVMPEQVAPAEVGALEQIDLAHDEVRQHAQFLRLPLPHMPTQRALHAGQRNDGAAVWAVLGWRLTFAQMPVEVDFLFDRPVHQAGCAEVQHDALGLDHARKLLRVDGPQTTTDHLDEGGLVGAGSQQNDAAGGRVVVAFGEHRHVDHNLGTPSLVIREARFAIRIGQLAVDEHGVYACFDKRIADVLRMRDRRAEDDGLARRRVRLPVLDHRFRDQPLVENGCDLIHVEVHRGATDMAKCVLHTDVDHEGARRHKVPGRDHLAQRDLICDV